MCDVSGVPQAYDMFMMTGVGQVATDRHNPLFRAIKPDRTAPDDFFGAFKFRKPLRGDLIASGERFASLAADLAHSNGFVFTATLKQFKKNQGTIVSIAPKNGRSLPVTRFAIVSNAKTDTLQLQYGSGSAMNSATFQRASITDPPKTWNKVVLSVVGSSATLYVNCAEIGTVRLESLFYKTFDASGSDLRLANAVNGMQDYKVR